MMYAVMKLLTSVDLAGAEVKINGIAGYIPIFKTIEEAKENSNDGEYQILAIQKEIKEGGGD